MTKKAWWVCNVCGRHVAPVGAGHMLGAVEMHRRMTCPKSTVSIRNIAQSDVDRSPDKK